jgi:hypothetical protein
MADTSTKIQGPVLVQSDSTARVAYDLMMLIARDSKTKPEERSEQWWLTLYAKCWSAAHHGEGPKKLPMS